MDQLIRINYDTEQPTVSARDLHEQLNIGTAFKDWFPRMCEYGFEEGKDFCSKLSETSAKGGRPSKDADISIDMAKQICMIQRTPEGKQIRQYFIDLEKAWNTPEQIFANRITQNRAKGRNTFIFIDEIYLLFQQEYSANFLFTLWKRVRKYGAYCTGITQNVDDLLQSHTARTMLANSEFIIMLNQASTDRLELAKLLNISDLQMSYITNVGAGQGLLKVGSSLVPFVNKFPRNTELYRLMTTKFGEV